MIALISQSGLNKNKTETSVFAFSLFSLVSSFAFILFIQDSNDFMLTFNKIFWAFIRNRKSTFKAYINKCLLFSYFHIKKY